MTIPSEFSYPDLDGDLRTDALQLNAAGLVSPLTAASMRVLPLEQLRRERDRLLGFGALSPADWVTLGHLRRRIAELEAPIADLEAELAAATAARDRLLDELTPYNESVRGDGWYARARAVRHDQLLRSLELAEDRVVQAAAALTALTAASAA